VLRLGFGIPAMVLAAAACGGGGAGGGGYGAPAATSASGGAASSAGAAVVTMAKLGPGQALVDGSGRALYLFEKDTATTSMCDGACAAVWPPLLTHGTPTAAGGAQAGQLGATPRKDGTVQVTYHGHPLYYFAADKAPGESHGEGVDGFGAKWYLLTPAGDKLDKD
jgi:predicted lipoprotein with Yx(FWY)xxD motif